MTERDSTVDIKTYCVMGIWNIHEAITFYLGQDPEKIKWKEIKHHTSIKFVQDYKKLSDLLDRAIMSHELAHRVLDPYGDYTIIFKPLDFIKWAKKKGIESFF